MGISKIYNLLEPFVVNPIRSVFYRLLIPPVQLISTEKEGGLDYLKSSVKEFYADYVDGFSDIITVINNSDDTVYINNIEGHVKNMYFLDKSTPHETAQDFDWVGIVGKDLGAYRFNDKSTMNHFKNEILNKLGGRIIQLWTSSGIKIYFMPNETLFPFSLEPKKTKQIRFRIAPSTSHLHLPDAETRVEIFLDYKYKKSKLRYVIKWKYFNKNKVNKK